MLEFFDKTPAEIRNIVATLGSKEAWWYDNLQSKWTYKKTMIRHATEEQPGAIEDFAFLFRMTDAQMDQIREHFPIEIKYYAEKYRKTMT